MNTTLLARSLLFAALAYSTTASAATSVFQLDFEGVASRASINDFYNGGTDSEGNSGVNYGVSFDDNAWALTETDPDANFTNEPTPITAMIFVGGPAIINHAPGFSNGFSFYYSTTEFSGQVDLFDGINATGNLLGSLHLSALGEGPDLDNPFSNWETASLSFAGLAKSANFSNTIGEVGFDNITFGSIDPRIPAVPEPSTAAQFLIGLGLAAVMRRYYKFKNKA